MRLAELQHRNTLSVVRSIARRTAETSATVEISPPTSRAASPRSIPEEDAPAVARLRGAGAIIFGKTQTSEFGWKAATANPLFPETRNPRAPTYSAGGSSGGSAAAVAAGYCHIAIGTDAAGSRNDCAVMVAARATDDFGSRCESGMHS